MSEQKALFLESIDGDFVVRTKPIQKPGPGQLLVKVQATALNPVDWKIPVYKIPLISEYPAIVGWDSAGIVDEVGEGVSSFKKGDRVLHEASLHNDKASFQQYTIVPAKITAKIPSNISFDEAAAVPAGLVTAAEGLFGNANRVDEGAKKLLVPSWEAGGEGAYKGKSVVVFGGATSNGQYAVQLLRLSGFSKIITTASLHNADFLKSFGVTHVIDRKSDVVAEAKKILNEESVNVVYDAVSLEDTQTQALDIVAPGGQVISLHGVQVEKEKYTDKHIISVVGNAHSDNVRALAVSLFSKLTDLLASGALKPNRVEVLPNGLAGIPAGLKRMEENAISGVKLVARPFETS